MQSLCNISFLLTQTTLVCLPATRAYGDINIIYGLYMHLFYDPLLSIIHPLNLGRKFKFFVEFFNFSMMSTFKTGFESMIQLVII